jgi:hypothetical protein
MKRHAIALLAHPCKDCLLPRKVLTERLNGYLAALVEAAGAFQSIKVNLVLPASFLELLDPLILLNLRELHKRNQLEWLFTGYTEPFVSFSPPWLIGENLKHGTAVFGDLAGARPAGIVLPFSNWEPSAINIFKAAGIQFCVVSKSLLREAERRLLGYWLTEHMGSSIPFFPSAVVNHSKIPALCAHIDAVFKEDYRTAPPAKILCIDMIYSLSLPAQNAAADLAELFRTLDKLMLSYQTVRCTEFISSHFSLGLNYLPPGIVYSRDASECHPQFLNELHTYDHVGLLQRKMMDIADAIALSKETKQLSAVKKELFFVQDIGHYLPSATSGFLPHEERTWCYRAMIGIEQNLFADEEISGGHIRITDLLRNGNKAIIMSNKSLSLCIDYKNGGQVFEFDYKARRHNLCAASGPRHGLPMIVEAPLSKTSFVDHCLPLDTGCSDFSRQSFRECGDFACEDFGYKVKKTSSGIKTVLLRNGTLLQGEKNCPLTVEKVLGLEKDDPRLSFVYQLSNTSLTSYSLRFAIECTFSLPGLPAGLVRIVQGKNVCADLGAGGMAMDQVTQWAVEDSAIGLRMDFTTQKPLDVWCLPLFRVPGDETSREAVTVVIGAAVSLEGSKSWSLMGTMELVKTRALGEVADEI